MHAQTGLGRSEHAKQELGRTKGLHGLQLRRHLLTGLPKNTRQLPGVSGVLGCEQRVGLSRGASAACPADAMDVVLHAIGKVVVHHTAHIGNLQSISAIVRGNK